MDKQTRQKFQEFVLAECGLGGHVRYSTRRYYGRVLHTHDNVSIDLSLYRESVKELIAKGMLIRNTCTDEYKIGPFVPFNSENAGKRKTVYTYAMTAYRRGAPLNNDPGVFHLTHIVTPWGTFGNCTRGIVYESFIEAKEALLVDIENDITQERENHKRRVSILQSTHQIACCILSSEEESTR